MPRGPAIGSGPDTGVGHVLGSSRLPGMFGSLCTYNIWPALADSNLYWQFDLLPTPSNNDGCQICLVTLMSVISTPGCL